MDPHVHFAERRVALTHRWTQDSLARETDDTTTLTPFKIHYQVGDHLGSTALELDPQGRLITYEEFFPFGGSSFIAGRSKRDIDLKQYRYAGKLRDDTTGLYYFGYRYYAPFIGGWLSPDPIGPEDGLNLYRFVHKNPIRFTDPNGLETVRLEGTWVLPERLQPLLNDPNPQAGRTLREWVESLPRRRGDSIWILDKGRVDFVESPVPLERGAWVYTINEKASEDLLPARPPVYSDNPEANGSPPLDTDE